MFIDDELEGDYFVLFGDDFRSRCRVGDGGFCGNLEECPEEDSENQTVDEAELMALVTAHDLAGIGEFIHRNRDHLDLVLDRELILLLRENRPCGEDIVRVYEVRGLRATLLD